MKIENEQKQTGYWIGLVAVLFILGILLGSALGNSKGYRRGQIDAIEGRVYYKQIGYIRVEGE